MAYAKNTYTGNGSTQNFTVSFPYLSQSHVEVYVDDVLKAVTTDYTWSNATTIHFNTAPANGAVVVLRRNSSQATRIVDYQDGSTLTEALMDADANQVFYIAQESFDKAEDAYAAASGVTVPVLPIVNGGTGSNTAAGARSSLEITPSNIGAVATSDIGVTVQAYDADIVKADQAQTFTFPQRGTPTTETSANTFDLTDTNNFKRTTNAALSLSFDNIASAAGQSGLILLVNTGGYTISAAGTTKVGSSTLSTLTSAGTYLLTYFCDGTNVYVVNSGALA